MKETNESRTFISPNCSNWVRAQQQAVCGNWEATSRRWRLHLIWRKTPWNTAEIVYYAHVLHFYSIMPTTALENLCVLSRYEWSSRQKLSKLVRSKTTLHSTLFGKLDSLLYTAEENHKIKRNLWKNMKESKNEIKNVYTYKVTTQLQGNVYFM